MSESRAATTDRTTRPEGQARPGIPRSRSEPSNPRAVTPGHPRAARLTSRGTSGRHTTGRGVRNGASAQGDRQRHPPECYSHLRRASPTDAQLKAPKRPAGPLRLPHNGFTYYLTLSSKFFSTFPHGTCLLSVSREYLVLGGVYHPLWAAFSNNPTPRRHQVDEARPESGLTPSMGVALIRRTKGRSTPTRRNLYATFRTAAGTARFSAGLFPIHSPLLRESQLLSFPPLNNMLKFSG